MQNLTNALDFHARIRPSDEALIYGDTRISWRQLQQRVQKTAAGLKEQGVGPESIVAMVMKNSACFVELLYAISHLGAVSLPVNFRLSQDEIDFITGHAGASLIIADQEFESSVRDLETKVIFLDASAQDDSRKVFGKYGSVEKAHPRDGNDLFRLMYTSGTTDRPKGVMHSYDNYYWKCLAHIMALPLSADDKLAVVGPLYHVGACDLPGLGVHLVGGALIIVRNFDPVQLLHLIEQEQISGIWLAPVMTSAVLSVEPDHGADVSSLKWCIGGGEKTPESRIRSFASFFTNARYIDAYGMTETISGDTLMDPGREIEKIGSVGRPVSFVEVEIRDATGKTLGPHEEGEICMSGKKVSEGYWKDQERTMVAMFEDGFLRSGDIGYLDDDGFLFLTDRKKDMIISGGENIASSEIERVIYEMPEILEVAVVGRTDDKWGEVPIAIIVPRPDAKITFEMLDEHCRRHLAGFKCPKDLVISTGLPRNPSGKVLKRVLRDQNLAKH